MERVLVSIENFRILNEESKSFVKEQCNGSRNGGDRLEAVKGKKTFHVTVEEFKDIVSSYSSIEVEIGTGNGKFVYESAKKQPETFFIGIDADKSSLVEYSRKVYRKPERGGLPNVLYVVSSAENLPIELDTTADIIWVILPWGVLLQKLILGKKSVLKNIVRISRLKGILKMFISYDLKYEPAEMEKLGLPELTVSYVDEELAPLYKSEQIMITKREFVDNEAMKEVSSTWAKRLAFGRNRRTLFISAEIDKKEMLL